MSVSVGVGVSVSVSVSVGVRVGVTVCARTEAFYSLGQGGQSLQLVPQQVAGMHHQLLQYIHSSSRDRPPLLQGVQQGHHHLQKSTDTQVMKRNTMKV